MHSEQTFDGGKIMKFIKNNSYLLLVVAVCILFTLIGTHKMSNEMEFDKVVVVEGDTLWAYSLKYGQGNIPNDKWINDVVTLNNLTSTTIKVGDELKLPKIPALVDQTDIATIAGESQ